MSLTSNTSSSSSSFSLMNFLFGASVTMVTTIDSSDLLWKVQLDRGASSLPKPHFLLVIARATASLRSGLLVNQENLKQNVDSVLNRPLT